MRKLTVLFALFALVPFALAACGDDDDDETTAQQTTETTTDADTDADADAGGGGGETVAIAADPGGALAYDTAKLTASAGPAEFDFENPASIPHDFCLEQDGSEIGCTETITDSSDTLEQDLESGEYAFYCSVAGHRQAGMEGTLTVK